MLLLDDSLTTKAVQGASLALEGVHHVHGSHGLPLGVLGVSDGITDNVLQEDLEHAASLFVDEARDALDTATAGQTTDGRLGNALDVITKDLAVALGASFTQSLSSLAAASHGALCRSARSVPSAPPLSRLCHRQSDAKVAMGLDAPFFPCAGSSLASGDHFFTLAKSAHAA